MYHPQSSHASHTSIPHGLLPVIITGTLYAGKTPYPPVPNDEDVGDEIAPQSDAGDDSLEVDDAKPATIPPAPGKQSS